MTLKELLEKQKAKVNHGELPSHLIPWAELWLPTIMSWSEEQLIEFIFEFSGQPWEKAYERIVSMMSVDEKLSEMKLRQQALKKLNEDNAKFIEQQRLLFCSFLAKLILSLKE